MIGREDEEPCLTLFLKLVKEQEQTLVKCLLDIAAAGSDNAWSPVQVLATNQKLIANGNVLHQNKLTWSLFQRRIFCHARATAVAVARLAWTLAVWVFRKDRRIHRDAQFRAMRLVDVGCVLADCGAWNVEGWGHVPDIL